MKKVFKLLIVTMIYGFVYQTSSAQDAKSNASVMFAPFDIMQNTPNPFNEQTKIKFVIPGKGSVQVNVYDVNSRLVKTLLKKKLEAGEYEVEWNGTDKLGKQVQPGIYCYEVKAGNQSRTKRMLLI